MGRGNRAFIGACCPSISLVPEECANIIGDTCGGHVIPFGRMQRAHLRARRVNLRCERRCRCEHHPHSCTRRPKVRIVSKHKIPLPAQLKRVNLNAAGIDIGSEEHWAAVPPGRVLKDRMCAALGLSPEIWVL